MKLSANAISNRLKEVSGWREQKGKLTKQFRFPTYMEGVDFVIHVAKLAEELQHHPEVILSYAQVEIQLITHDEGGITEKDFAWIQRLENSTPHIS
ncbi:4a-hydroxytetrahydrobiopterin dehydratase [Marininema halotolerans]|uniref:4a-hydroxytetrahydrobiopterin dehydratase n=1 Tax=Marininema halotolerans TaxID=1155944 RepID=A0A1I6STP0_9BACL|nr:4a-hydroxytetrahydrobiopterin dehydratase [Marininema halotolerans]SFS80263.1 4a-hydroxytetrahydrobiopterin dehydratase [Marininema halotolerans]